MKLVDILARELKVWPGGVRIIIQQDSGYLFDEGNYPLDINVEVAEDNSIATVTRAQWQAAVDALKADEIAYSTENVNVNVNYATHASSPVNAECKIVQPEWTGEGLPPVGMVCECHLPGELTNNYSWVEAKVIWHNGPTECAVVRSTSKLAWCDEFRPIRTPEQIVAEQLRNDELMYGTSYAVTREDGSLERIDPAKIIIRHRGA